MADYSRTTRLFVGQDVLKAPPGDKFLRAVQRAVEGDFEVLGELGRGGKGKIVYLARESRSRHLVALQLLLDEGDPKDGSLSLDVLKQLDASVPSAEGKCPSCGHTMRGWGRFCGQCGSDLSGIAAGAGDASADRLLEAVKQVAGAQYEVLGQMDRSEGGGVVYFAKERGSGKIVALRLQKEAPAADGRERYNLGQTMVINSVVGSLLGPEPTPAPPPTSPQPDVAMGRPRPPEPLPPVQPIDRGRVLFYGFGAAGIIAVIGLAWVLGGRRGRAATHVPPPRDSVTIPAAKPDSGEIQVGGTLPAETAITVDGEPMSGLVLRRAAGAHRLKATAPGYTTAEQEIDLRGGQTVIWTPALVRSRAPKPPPAAARPRPVVRTPPADTGQALAIRQAPAPPLPRDTTLSGPLTTAGATCGSLFSALEWSRALVACEREAANGGTAAQRTLGTMYERGLATEASPSTAAQWYAKAAEAGDRLAQYRLGVLLRSGRGVKKDEKAALKWFQRSADQGEADAQLAVGQAYDRGDGVKRSRTTAAAWYLKAAEQGKADAQFRLGEFSEKGEAGLPKSDTEAIKWYKLAAAQGHEQAREKLAKLARPS